MGVVLEEERVATKNRDCGGIEMVVTKGTQDPPTKGWDGGVERDEKVDPVKGTVWRRRENGGPTDFLKSGERNLD